MKSDATENAIEWLAAELGLSDQDINTLRGMLWNRSTN